MSSNPKVGIFTRPAIECWAIYAGWRTFNFLRTRGMVASRSVYDKALTGQLHGTPPPIAVSVSGQTGK